MVMKMSGDQIKLYVKIWINLIIESLSHGFIDKG